MKIMIEVYQMNDGWRWRFIGGCGRELVTSVFAYRTQYLAANIAKMVRKNFFIAAEAIDHRQGACI